MQDFVVRVTHHSTKKFTKILLAFRSRRTFQIGGPVRICFLGEKNLLRHRYAVLVPQVSVGSHGQRTTVLVPWPTRHRGMSTSDSIQVVANRCRRSWCVMRFMPTIRAARFIAFWHSRTAIPEQYLAPPAIIGYGTFVPLKLDELTPGQFQVGCLQAFPYLLARNLQPCENHPGWHVTKKVLVPGWLPTALFFGC